MDKNTVIWWLFDPPSDAEQKSLDTMKFSNVVWAADGVEYLTFEENAETPVEALNVVRKLQEFAQKHNASAIIGHWSNAVYEFIKSIKNPIGIKCYSSRVITNPRNAATRHKFVAVGEI